MGNSSAQNTRSAWITQVANDPDSIYQEVGQLVVPGSSARAPISAHPPALLEDAVREAPASLSLPGERVGATSTKRCIPLFASVVACSGRKPGHVCVSVPISGFFGVCQVGHTQLPTGSRIFQRFIKGHTHP